MLSNYFNKHLELDFGLHHALDLGLVGGKEAKPARDGARDVGMDVRRGKVGNELVTSVSVSEG